MILLILLFVLLMIVIIWMNWLLYGLSQPEAWSVRVLFCWTHIITENEKYRTILNPLRKALNIWHAYTKHNHLFCLKAYANDFCYSSLLVDIGFCVSLKSHCLQVLYSVCFADSSQLFRAQISRWTREKMSLWWDFVVLRYGIPLSLLLSKRWSSVKQI